MTYSYSLPKILKMIGLCVRVSRASRISTMCQIDAFTICMIYQRQSCSACGFREFRRQTNMTASIGVVGAGISGLSTAVRIQEVLPSVQITLIADRYSPNTTSDCAAGIWYPGIQDEFAKDHRLRRWSISCHEYIQQQYESPAAADRGVSLAIGFLLYKNKQTEPLSDLWISCDKLSGKQTRAMFPDYVEAYKCTTYMCEPYRHLPYLMKRFEENGGSYYQANVKQLSELYDHYDVIVNTSGVRSHDLVSDNQVYPIRGQVCRVRAPWVKHFIKCPEVKTYIYPGTEYVVLGGTKDKGDWNMNVSDSDRESILEKTTAIIPSLKNAEVVKENVGLRPGRERVRLEAETVDVGKKTIHIIHNYGHGGFGVTMFWGCAKEAADLVKDAVMSNGTAKTANTAAKL